MKTVINLLIVGVLFVGANHIEHNYTMKDCEVVEATKTGALIVDGCGETWYVEDEGFAVGQMVDLRINDNGTPHSGDDEIRKVIIK